MSGAPDAVPLVVIAASARALAECLCRAGLPDGDAPLLAVDAFGDDDLIATVDGWQHLALADLSCPRRVQAALRAVLKASGVHELGALHGRQETGPDALVPASMPGADVLLGGGFDGAFEVLEALGARYRLLNAPTAAWRAARDPLLFARLGIDAPETRLEPPLDPRGWLRKATSGSAGLGVRLALDVPLASPAAGDPTAFHWQRRLQGIPVSLLFCAHAGGIVPLGFNRQWCSPAKQMPFRFGGVASGFDAGPAGRAALIDAAQRVTAATGLRGLCSLDAVIDRRGRVHALEVNPRPTASVELYDRTAPGLLRLHIAAVAGRPLPEWQPADGSRALALVRAPCDLQAGGAPSDASDWRRGAKLGVDEPLCTIHAAGSDAGVAMRRATAASRRLRHRLQHDVDGFPPDPASFSRIAPVPAAAIDPASDPDLVQTSPERHPEDHPHSTSEPQERPCLI